MGSLNDFERKLCGRCTSRSYADRIGSAGHGICLEESAAEIDLIFESEKNTADATKLPFDAEVVYDSNEKEFVDSGIRRI